MPVDDLADYGVHPMDDAEIETFLSEQRLGVLSLPTGDAPVMRPMSFVFDAPDSVYFLYILTAESEKEAATDSSEPAEFLVYDAEDRYHWESVILTGTMRPVPESDREAIQEQIDLAWRPEVLERASESMNTRLYEFEITDRTGRKHDGLPEAYERRI